MGIKPDEVEIVTCTPLKALGPFELGMTLDDAVGRFGPPVHTRSDGFTAFWERDAHYRCLFSEGGPSVDMKVACGEERRAQIGEELLLSRDFDVAVEQLGESFARGYKHFLGDLVVFPQQA
jgi:hypothetical protein